VSIDGESYIVALPHRNTSFRSIVVKPYLTTEDDDNTSIPDPLREPTEHLTIEVPKRKRGRPRKATSLIVDYETFVQSDEE
jgi:hypothetical protein